MNHLKYLSYVIRHKWYVFLECCKLGVPWRGIVHDLSKFSPSECGPYVEWFNGTYGVKFKKAMEDMDFIDEDLVELHRKCKYGFDMSWLHHQRRNLHHWQYWLLRNDDGTTGVMEMPKVYAREMVADWRGAGMAIHGRNECVEWYIKNQYKMVLHPMTRNFIEGLLSLDTWICSSCNSHDGWELENDGEGPVCMVCRRRIVVDDAS